MSAVLSRRELSNINAQQRRDISSLTNQVAQLKQSNANLRAKLAEAEQDALRVRVASLRAQAEERQGRETERAVEAR